MIGVIDYAAGNITSVANALASIGVDFRLSNKESELAGCDGIILPGVGAAQKAMESINGNNLAGFLQSYAKPFLGICLGMELLYEISDEGNTPCLGIIPGRVKMFDAAVPKIPHMGWNRVMTVEPGTWIGGKGDLGYYYFAHSYYVPVDRFSLAISESGVPFASVVKRLNYYGVQFHPEKSGDAGLALLKKFDALCKSSRQ
jgi:imidazole glycerol-phosphate synthase subunit HisH